MGRGQAEGGSIQTPVRQEAGSFEEYETLVALFERGSQTLDKIVKEVGFAGNSGPGDLFQEATNKLVSDGLATKRDDTYSITPAGEKRHEGAQSLHVWFYPHDYDLLLNAKRFLSCARCGIVRARDGSTDRKPCKGEVKMELR